MADDNWLRTLDRRTVFISYSSDMTAEAKAVESVILELSDRLPKPERFEPFRWANLDKSWPASGTWQDYIPRPCDPNAELVICLFGERLGEPLPDYFERPADLELPPWIKWPWRGNPPPDGDPGTVPLTGTLFELLDALKGWRRGETKGPAVLCYVKGDPALFADRNKPPLQKQYGFGQHFARLAENKEALLTSNYAQQITWLDRFFTNFRSHPLNLFDDTGDLRQKLLKILPDILKVPTYAATRDSLKKLERYEPHDHDILFGRDGQIEEIQIRLRSLARARKSGASQFPVITLVGKEGEGKSSVLRAGLIGRLRQGRSLAEFGNLAFLLDADALKGQPLHNLADEANKTLDGEVWNCIDRLDQYMPEFRPAKLIEGIGKALKRLKHDQHGPPRGLFIGLDQMEELLDAAEENPGQREGLLQLLEAVRLFAAVPLGWVVLTMPTGHHARFGAFIQQHFTGERQWSADKIELVPPSDSELENIVRNSLIAAGLHLLSTEVTVERGTGKLATERASGSDAVARKTASQHAQATGSNNTAEGKTSSDITSSTEASAAHAQQRSAGAEGFDRQRSEPGGT